MEEIGKRLRSVRESRGISLDTAEEETRIRRKYIEALEDGLAHELPGEVYLKGFLRSYGNYLGLDGGALVEQYKDLRNGRRHQRAAAAEEAPADPGGPPPAPVPERRAAPRPRPAATRQRSLPLVGSISRSGLTNLILVLAALAVVGYLGWVIAGQFSTEKPPAGSGAPNEQVTPPPVATQPAPTPAPSLPPPPQTTMNRGTGEEVLFAVPASDITVRLEFGSTERLWMQAIVDGVVRYDAFPVDGGVAKGPLEFSGKSIRLRMGHMNEVTVVVNGQRFERPLARGPYTLIFKGQP